MIVVQQLVPQAAAPHLVMAGSTLAWSHGASIELREVREQKPGTRFPVDPVDDAVALGTYDNVPIALVKSSKRAGLYNLSTATEMPVEYPALLAGAERVYASGDTLFIAHSRRLELHRAKDPFERVKVVRWQHDELTSFTGMGAGVYFYDGAAFVRVGRDGALTSYTSSEGAPLHVAAGPRPDTLWTTQSDELQLVELADGKATVSKRVKLPGIYHLASAGDAAAVLTVEMTAGRYSKITVTVVEADGRVRWTTSLPPPTSTVGWIAGSQDAVAIAFGDELHVWAAKTGTPIELRP